MISEREKRRPRLALLLLLLAAIALAAGGLEFFRRQRVARRGYARTRITAELFYIAIAPPSDAARLQQKAISQLKLHYRVRNNGPDIYAPPARMRTLERELTALLPPARGIRVDLPQSIPPLEEREIVVVLPYGAELVTAEEWGRLYPGRELEPAAAKLPRLAVSIDLARKLMAADALTAQQVLDRFEIVAGEDARENTTLGRTILHRKYPRLSGFALFDDEGMVRIDLPVPPS